MQSEKIEQESVDAQSDEGMMRLHKASPIFIFIDTIKHFLLPAAVALFSAGGSSYWEYIALGVAALFSLIAIVQYRFYRYWLEDEQIRVKEGVFFRNVRRVPYHKIQNLNLIQGPLHRLLGVIRVQLESASGGKPEAILSVVDMNAVRLIQAKVDAVHHGDEPLSEEATPSELETDTTDGIATEKASLLRMNAKDIIRYGFITNRGLVVVAVTFGFLGQFANNLKGSYIAQMAMSAFNTVRGLFNTLFIENSILSNIFVVLTFIIVGILSLWLLSIVMAFLRLHGFKLEESKGKLSATMGLLTRLKGTIPMSRIQSITVSNSWLHQKFGKVTVKVETAGGVNQQQQGVSIKEVGPLVAKEERKNFLTNIQKDVDWEAVIDGKWTNVQQRAWKRVLKVNFIFFGVLSIPLVFWTTWSLGVALILNAIANYFYAKAYVRNAKYYLEDNIVGYKSGVIFKKETYVRLPKVQSVCIKENLFDRRHGMAKLEIDTAGATPGAHHIYIPYIELADAEQLLHTVSDKVKNVQFQW